MFGSVYRSSAAAVHLSLSTLKLKSKSIVDVSPESTLKFTSKPVVNVFSEPLVILPTQVKLTDIDSQDQLKNPGADPEKFVAEKIAREAKESKATDSAKKGYIEKDDANGLTYDVIYNVDLSFIGCVYPNVVGSGSYGEVRLVYQQKNWYVSKEVEADENTEESFNNEFECARKADLALFHVSNKDKDKNFLVMKWIPGPNLEDFFDKDKGPAISSKQLMQITRSMFQCVLGISGKICHRDIKPGNFVNPYNVTTLVDYGISLNISAEDEEISDEQMGTPFYIAPELNSASLRQALSSNTISPTKARAHQVDGFSLAMATANIHQFWNSNYRDKTHPFKLILNPSFNNEPRLISEKSDEFKKNINIPDEPTRAKLLNLLTRMSENDPKKRLGVREGNDELKEICDAQPITPTIKPIIHVAEINDLLLKIKKLKKFIKDKSITKENRSDAQKKMVDLHLECDQFIEALKIFEVVLLAAEKKHDIVERSKVYRFITEENFFANTKRQDNLAPIVNVKPELFRAESDGPVSILDVVNGIPDAEAKNDNEPSYFVFLTIKNRKELLSNVITLHPAEVIEMSRLHATVSASTMSESRKGALLKARGMFAKHLYSSKLASEVLSTVASNTRDHTAEIKSHSQFSKLTARRSL